jgi:hypothetical protein
MATISTVLLVEDEPIHAPVQRRFAPYLANKLASAEQTRVGDHLRHCPACATALVRFLQELRATTALLGSLPRHPAPLALREWLLAIPDRASVENGHARAEASARRPRARVRRGRVAPGWG